MSQIEITDELIQEFLFQLKKQTEKTAYSMKLDTFRTPTIFDSKVGGTPYFPDNMEIPLNSTGSPLLLLAQVNLADAPHAEGLPHTGILQFYIDNDDCFGMDFDDPTSNKDFRVIYHSEIDCSVSEEAIRERFGMDDIDEYLLPQADKVIGLQFNETTTSLSPSDYHFEAIWNAFLTAHGVAEDELEDYAWWEIFDDQVPNMPSTTGHWLTGYPFFTQNDPREENEELADYELLFQLDSFYSAEEKSYGILWGDCGVGNFFIRKKDLANLDFSKALFNWDCC